MPSHLFLEPRADLDAAIVRRTRGGAPVYGYARLVAVFMALNEWDEETAAEWVDYNVAPLKPYGLKLCTRS